MEAHAESSDDALELVRHARVYAREIVIWRCGDDFWEFQFDHLSRPARLTVTKGRRVSSVAGTGILHIPPPCEIIGKHYDLDAKRRFEQAKTDPLPYILEATL